MDKLVTFERDKAAAQAEKTRLSALRGNLRKRATMLRTLRAWFANADFDEMTTPVRLGAPALEDYIDAVPADEGYWLRTSPELHLKRLLAAGWSRLYEIGPCFRLGEHGDHHRTEFTMLEWYRAGGNWQELMDDAQSMIRACVEAVAPGAKSLPFRDHQINFAEQWPRLTVSDAFAKYAGKSLHDCIAAGEFETVLCTEVEPHLGIDAPLFLTEYPIECSGLSAALPRKPGFVARWELYIAGLEIGNACTELVDPAEQERRFEATAQLRANDHRPVYPMDQPFMNAMWDGMTPAAGTAIGLDRLAMVLCNAADIAEVRAFL
jgi:elongation factor P--(R)-beta-lysine ligase